MADDWYRNTSWDDSTSLAFEAKLARAHKKDQYLRIQACTLATARPRVALQLLDRYFELPVCIDRAQAHVDMATALHALGEEDMAAAAYEAALEREEEFPNVLTQAYLELPLLIATAPLPDRYQRALELLDDNEDRVKFPVEQFRWHASRAFILHAQGRVGPGSHHAQLAVVASQCSDSGLRYHPTFGLIDGQYDGLVQRLADFAES